MMKLIETHEHYPIIVTQRFINTSRSAEKIVIRSREETLIKEWQYKYEQVYAELIAWKEKITWYEQEHNRYINEIQMLKQTIQTN